MLELINVGFEVVDEQSKSVKHILKNINLKFETGKFVVITGPNGSGKSSLAKLIMGIEKPTEGKILFNGKDITNIPINERAKLGIGFAFQQPVKFKGLSVSDLLRISADHELTMEESCEILSKVGLCSPAYIYRELNDKLSGGELKRIEIAMLIAKKRLLSVFDEPEAGIDLWSFNNLIKVFELIRESTEGSVIIISHQERILDIADQIILLKDGEVVEYDSKEKVLPKLFEDASIFNCNVRVD